MGFDAIARIEPSRGSDRDDRAAVGVLTVEVRVRQMDPVGERALGRALQADVERQPQRLTGLRQHLEGGRGLRTSARVDCPLRLAVAPTQVGVVARFDPGLADRVGRLVAVPSELRVLRRRDLPDVAEHLRRQRLIRVLAQPALREPDARERLGVLAQVVDLVVVQTGLDDDRGQRIQAVLAQLSQHVAHRDAGHQREAPQLTALGGPALRQVGRPDLDAGARNVRTRTCPERSRIGPRGAWMLSVRTRLSFACAR